MKEGLATTLATLVQHYCGLPDVMGRELVCGLEVSPCLATGDLFTCPVHGSVTVGNTTTESKYRFHSDVQGVSK